MKNNNNEGLPERQEEANVGSRPEELDIPKLASDFVPERDEPDLYIIGYDSSERGHATVFLGGKKVRSKEVRGWQDADTRDLRNYRPKRVESLVSSSKTWAEFAHYLAQANYEHSEERSREDIQKGNFFTKKHFITGEEILSAIETDDLRALGKASESREIRTLFEKGKKLLSPQEIPTVGGNQTSDEARIQKIKSEIRMMGKKEVPTSENSFSQARNLDELYNLIRKEQVLVNSHGQEMAAEDAIRYIERGVLEVITNKNGLRDKAKELRDLAVKAGEMTEKKWWKRLFK